MIGAVGCSGAARETAVIHVPDPVAPSASAAAGEEPLALEEPAPAPRPKRIAVRDDPADDVPDDRERARTLFQQGAEAYAQGDYLLARDKFQAAYDLVAEPALLFNIATAELRLGNTADACRLFRKYVSDGEPADPRIQDVQRQVAMRCRGIP